MHLCIQLGYSVYRRVLRYYSGEEDGLGMSTEDNCCLDVGIHVCGAVGPFCAHCLSVLMYRTVIPFHRVDHGLSLWCMLHSQILLEFGL